MELLAHVLKPQEMKRNSLEIQWPDNSPLWERQGRKYNENIYGQADDTNPSLPYWMSRN